MSNAVATREPKHTVEIKNIGVIKDLVFDLPDDSGGVLVLKGANRVGKSTAIRILRALLSGKGRLETRDGAVRGMAEAFGQRVSVTSQTRFAGDCLVESLEGKFDFSDLVHPEAKEPETRDRIRIKALLSLTGVAADVSIFYPLVGGQAAFEKLVPSDSIKKKDLVELAGVVHRALHAEAQKKESEADFELGHARSCKDQAGGVEEVNGQIDLPALHAASAAAAGKVSGIEQRIKHAQENDDRYNGVRAAINEACENYSGPSIEEAEYAASKAGLAQVEAQDRVAQLEKQLAVAKVEAQKAVHVLNSANDTARRAHERYKAIKNLNSMLADAEQAVKDRPSDEEYAAAVAAAEKAKRDVEMAVTIRDAQQKLATAKSHEEKAEAAATEAKRLREAARSVDHVLSQKLPTGPLRAEGGRLVLDTQRGESAPYDQCSAGEQWSYALPYGIKAVGQGGVLAVQQEAWDSLDQNNRRLIAQQAGESRTWIITGEVADGELRAEVFQP